MSTVRETKEYPGITADQAYKLAEGALDKSGFEIWKRRPLGWLIMADIEDEAGTIKGNASCRPGNGASITLTLDSGSHEEADLSRLVKTVFDAIDPGNLD